MNGYANNAGAAGSSASAYPYRAPAPKAHHKKKHRRHVKHAKSGGAGRIQLSSWGLTATVLEI